MSSTVPNDVAQCIDIVKSKSDAFRDAKQRTTQTPDDSMTGIDLRQRTSPAPRLHSSSPRCRLIPPEGAKKSGALHQCHLESSTEVTERKQVLTYIRHQLRSRKDLLRLLHLLDVRAPTDAALNPPLRGIIVRSGRAKTRCLQ